MADTLTADIRDIPYQGADGAEHTVAEFGEKALLIVNVASKCGLTPQYEQLEQLQKTYGDRGLQVIGFPCNQFMGQEPGSMDEILEYCSVTYGVTFPIADKVKVNGSHAAPLYKALKKTRNAEGAKASASDAAKKGAEAPLVQSRPRSAKDAVVLPATMT